MLSTEDFAASSDNNNNNNSTPKKKRLRKSQFIEEEAEEEEEEDIETAYRPVKLTSFSDSEEEEDDEVEVDPSCVDFIVPDNVIDESSTDVAATGDGLRRHTASQDSTTSSSTPSHTVAEDLSRIISGTDSTCRSHSKLLCSSSQGVDDCGRSPLLTPSFEGGSSDTASSENSVPRPAPRSRGNGTRTFGRDLAPHLSNNNNNRQQQPSSPPPPIQYAPPHPVIFQSTEPLIPAPRSLEYYNNYQESTTATNIFQYLEKACIDFQSQVDLKDLDDIKRKEHILFREMNHWIVFMPQGKSNVLIRVLNEHHRYEWASYTTLSAKQKLSKYTITTINHKMLRDYHSELNSPSIIYKPSVSVKKCKNRVSTCKDFRTGEKRYIVNITTRNQQVFDLWFNSNERATINQKIIEPDPYYRTHPTPGMLNLWGGFHYSRRAVQDYNDWQLLAPVFNHIKYTWCESEEEFQDIICRFALLMQKPWLKQSVAICIGGEQGTGKSIIINQVIGHLVGRDHYLHSQNINDIIGEFNGHLFGKVLIYVDEVPVLNDPRAISIMKALLSEPDQLVRNMYSEPTYKKSFANVIMSMNDYDGLPVSSLKDRRFLALTSNPKAYLEHATVKEQFPGGERDYFQHLVDVIEQNNHEVLKTMANFLYNVPIAGFNCLQMPITNWSVYSRLQKAGVIEKWWISHLLNSKLEEWQKEVTLGELYDKYKEIVKERAPDFCPARGLPLFKGRLQRILPDKTKYKSNLSVAGGVEVELPDYTACIADMEQRFPGFKHLCSTHSNVLEPMVRYYRMQKVQTYHLVRHFLPYKTGTYRLLEKWITNGRQCVLIREEEEWDQPSAEDSRQSNQLVQSADRPSYGLSTGGGFAFMMSDPGHFRRTTNNNNNNELLDEETQM